MDERAVVELGLVDTDFDLAAANTSESLRLTVDEICVVDDDDAVVVVDNVDVVATTDIDDYDLFEC